MQEGKRAGKNSPRKKFSENQLFKCFYAENAQSHGRLYLRIAKSVLHTAVSRNKVKRRIRTIYQEMNVSGKFDIYVSVKKTPPSDYGVFRESLTEVLRRIK